MLPAGPLTDNTKVISGTCTGDVAGDPRFANTADPLGADDTIGTSDDGLRIIGGSPAIDAGKNSDVPAGVTEDLAGQDRFRNDTGTTDTGTAATSGTITVVDTLPTGLSTAVAGPVLSRARLRRRSASRPNSVTMTTCSGSRVDILLDTVASGSSVTIVIVSQLDRAVLPVVNTAEVSSATADPDPTDNTTTETEVP